MAQSIAYYRVSTDKQGIRGLGMEAQREVVERFCKANDLQIIEEYCEVQSGKNDNRDQLWKAIDHCRKIKAVLVISKLDRLSRSVAFVSRLMETKVEFKCVDMPQANTLMLHIMAAFAQHEREVISQRTKAALAMSTKELGKHGKILAAERKDQSMAFAGMVAPIFRQLQGEGFVTIHQLMAELNARQVPGPSEKPWNTASVSRYRAKVALV
jgi:DNA invertase Pin-like site-specific DNA recombinase